LTNERIERGDRSNRLI